MTKRSTTFFALLAAAGMTLTACGEYTRDDAVKDLTEEGGISEEMANCIMDAVEEGGYTANDMTDGNIEDNPEVMDIVAEATFDCITLDDLVEDE